MLTRPEEPIPSGFGHRFTWPKDQLQCDSLLVNDSNNLAQGHMKGAPNETRTHSAAQRQEDSLPNNKPSFYGKICAHFLWAGRTGLFDICSLKRVSSILGRISITIYNIHVKGKNNMVNTVTSQGKMPEWYLRPVVLLSQIYTSD